MVELITELIGRGHAYPAGDGSGDVYFDVRSWAAYGELSGQKLDDMEAAADADPRGKRDPRDFALWKGQRSEEHTSELQSLMRISYAVFCLKKKKTNNNTSKTTKTTM